MRAVLGWLRQQARARGGRDSRGGAVVIVQRFGSALNLNVHLHAMVMHGVFTRDARGEVHFHAARYPMTPDLTPLLVMLARRIERLLARHGVFDAAEGVEVADPWAEEMPTLAGLADRVRARCGGVRAPGGAVGAALRRPGSGSRRAGIAGLARTCAGVRFACGNRSAGGSARSSGAPVSVRVTPGGRAGAPAYESRWASGARVDPYDLVWKGEDDEVMRIVTERPETALAGCGGVFTAVVTCGRRKLMHRLLDAGFKVHSQAGGCHSYLLETPVM
ncbi:MAG: transposase [Acidobacteria bacterium]|nr:transposase [Acidobacteriota bacterium]